MTTGQEQTVNEWLWSAGFVMGGLGNAEVAGHLLWHGVTTAEITAVKDALGALRRKLIGLHPVTPEGDEPT